eukprot:Skav222026  [mRNA]  locus=scaffold2914:124279:127486:+ [translate_table: standard]
MSLIGGCCRLFSAAWRMVLQVLRGSREAQYRVPFLNEKKAKDEDEIAEAPQLHRITVFASKQGSAWAARSAGRARADSGELPPSTNPSDAQRAQPREGDGKGGGR